MSDRPSVLFIVNRPGWAHDLKTDAIAAQLGDRFRIVKRFQSEVTAADLRQHDCVLIYFWLQIEQLGNLRSVLAERAGRIAMGICSEYELEGAWHEPGVRTLNELATVVFANNQTLVDGFTPQVHLPMYYTPNGVDTRFFCPAEHVLDRPIDRPLRVGWAGSLTNHGEAQRGVHDFIAPAVERVDGAELHLAAREQTWRSRDEMLEFYRSLDVYVCASRNEGTPNPCLEAAACGLPVVTTNVGNMPEFIVDGVNGLIVQRDIDDIAAKLRMLADPSIRRLMGAAARQTATEWDWGVQAEHYATMFDDLLAGRV